MNTREALLRAVVENPRADAPRLILADWLDEFGDAIDRDHADFIRRGIEYANTGRRDSCMVNSFTKYRGDWRDLIGRVWPRQFPIEWWWIGGFVAGGAFERGVLGRRRGVFAAHPIERVHLNGLAPLDGTTWLNRDAPPARRHWARPAPRNTAEQIAAASLPERLFRRLSYVTPYVNWAMYPDALAAVNALSAAAVSFGRAEAGLGEL